MNCMNSESHSIYVLLTPKLVISLQYVTHMNISVLHVFVCTNSIIYLSEIQQYKHFFSAVSTRVPAGSNNPSQTTDCPTPESCSQTPSNTVSPPMPPVYPSVDIDAHVSRFCINFCIKFYIFISHVLIYFEGKNSFIENSKIYE